LDADRYFSKDIDEVGDKIETAKCIAISTRLVAKNQHMFTIAHRTDPAECLTDLETLESYTDSCLVIDGESLHTCMEYHKALFARIVLRLRSVVACRCSPTQKAEIAELIKKETGKRVCCIGDGGNDVSMIQAAHVGIGLVGKEGKQASLAGDFSITQFSHLTRLLLWHGRNSCNLFSLTDLWLDKRSAKLSQFVIHRGLIIAIIQAVFSAIFYFTPIAIYQVRDSKDSCKGAIMVGYATLFTMFPVFSLVFDKDVSENTALLYPELYQDLRKVT
jgi:phospholipid-translocating ATPase